MYAATVFLVSLPFSTVESEQNDCISHETMSQFMTPGKMDLGLLPARYHQGAGEIYWRRQSSHAHRANILRTKDGNQKKEPPHGILCGDKCYGGGQWEG